MLYELFMVFTITRVKNT